MIIKVQHCGGDTLFDSVTQVATFPALEEVPTILQKNKDVTCGMVYDLTEPKHTGKARYIKFDNKMGRGLILYNLDAFILNDSGKTIEVLNHR